MCSFTSNPYSVIFSTCCKYFFGFECGTDRKMNGAFWVLWRATNIGRRFQEQKCFYKTQFLLPLKNRCLCEEQTLILFFCQTRKALCLLKNFQQLFNFQKHVTCASFSHCTEFLAMKKKNQIVNNWHKKMFCNSPHTNGKNLNEYNEQVIISAKSANGN